MRMVHKFPLPEEEVTIRLPGNDWKVVHVGEQHGVITVWVELDPAFVRKPVTFYSIFTGVALPENIQHVGSLTTGTLVWHIYHTSRP